MTGKIEPTVSKCPEVEHTTGADPKGGFGGSGPPLRLESTVQIHEIYRKIDKESDLEPCLATFQLIFLSK